MGISERRQREKEELRTQILDAARELFAQEGYEAVTMRKIAERIEYSATAIYFHFADKQELMRALCDQDFSVFAQKFVRFAKMPDPVERLKKSAKAYIEFAIENPNHYRLMFMTPGLPDKTDESSIERGNPEQDAYAFLKWTASECLASGRCRPEIKDEDVLAQTLWAGIHGVAALHIAKGQTKWVDWKPLRARTELMLEVMLHGVLKEDAA